MYWSQCLRFLIFFFELKQMIYDDPLNGAYIFTNMDIGLQYDSLKKSTDIVFLYCHQPTGSSRKTKEWTSERQTKWFILDNTWRLQEMVSAKLVKHSLWFGALPKSETPRTSLASKNIIIMLQYTSQITETQSCKAPAQGAQTGISTRELAVQTAFEPCSEVFRPACLIPSNGKLYTLYSMLDSTDFIAVALYS